MAGYMTNIPTYGQGLMYFTFTIVVIVIISYISMEINKKNNCPKLPGAPNTISDIFSNNTISNTLSQTPVNQLPINQLYIKTAYNCCCKGNFRNDYVDVVSDDQNIHYCALKNCALNGARALDFTIYQYKGIPIVSASTTNDISYKEQYNYLDFNITMQQVNRYFLLDRNTSYITDPLFLILRIQGDKKELYDNVAYSLTQTFGTGCNTGNKIYTNQISGHTKISEFQTLQVVIIVRPYNVELFNNSPLNQITALMMNPDSNIPYIHTNSDNVKSSYDTQILIVYPELIVSSSKNFNPTNSFTYGIPFIGMNFQHDDSNLKLYNKQFGKKSIVPQPIVSQ